MSGKIYWLASYPKSGNTWMRVLLTNYLRDGDEPADINALDTGTIASGRHVFDQYVGVEASDLTQDEIERYRPHVYEKVSRELTSPMFVKVHDAYLRTSDGIPLLSPAATAGVIYLVRNPLEVCVSFAHHNGATVDKTSRKMGESDFAFVDKPGRLHNQLRQKLLSWSGHVTSYLDEPGLRTLLIRYEDLLNDTEEVFTRVVDFCGFDADPQRIGKAVSYSKFDRLQSQEEAQGFSEKTPAAKSFFRKGKVDSWRESLDQPEIDRICRDHAAVMERLGYSGE